MVGAGCPSRRGTVEAHPGRDLGMDVCRYRSGPTQTCCAVYLLKQCVSHLSMSFALDTHHPSCMFFANSVLPYLHISQCIHPQNS